jgi:hypothetical protein
MPAVALDLRHPLMKIMGRLEMHTGRVSGRQRLPGLLSCDPKRNLCAWLSTLFI